MAYDPYRIAKRAIYCAIGVGLLTLGSPSWGPAIASERDEAYHQDYIYGAPADPSEAWLMANGARLYDNWISALDADKPEGTHPAWPASNTKKKGAVTWRCKSCHGWDYAGKDGAYAKGSYKTGIKGVRAFAGKDPAEIHKMMMAPVHGFTHDMIPKDAMLRIAAFVSRGQIDVSKYVNADKSVNGDPEKGKPIFQNVLRRLPRLRRQGTGLGRSGRSRLRRDRGAGQPVGDPAQDQGRPSGRRNARPDGIPDPGSRRPAKLLADSPSQMRLKS